MVSICFIDIKFFLEGEARDDASCCSLEQVASKALFLSLILLKVLRA